MQWIIDNRDWLFSGIAIAVPLAIIGWFFSFKSTKQIQKSGKNSVNIQIGRDVNLHDGRKDE